MKNELFSSLFYKARSATFVFGLGSQVAEINAAEAEVGALSDEGLKDAFNHLRESASEASLSSLLPKCFALVREASRRTIGIRHYDVQLLGAMALHQGKLAEMGTGEGKTHVIAMAAALNTLRGEPVHVITANAYLAQRDAELLRPVYELLGLTVGVTLDNLSPMQKQLAYQCDITYGVNFEFGFDYLRDNMVKSRSDRVQRGLAFAIVDEVDSTLIDEARTPLVISEEQSVQSAHYLLVDEIVKTLAPGRDYLVDEKKRMTSLTEAGFEKVEQALEQMNLVSREKGLYKEDDLILFKAVSSAIQVYAFYRRDREYVVQGGEIVIVDEATGRLMPGRRWGEGLHHAIEARERVTLMPENMTVATITYQNFFSLYTKLAGLSGTVASEAEEFVEIYGLAAITIPPHLPKRRVDKPDLVFATKAEKYTALVEETAQCQRRGQPVLIGTSSVAESEYLSKQFTAAGVFHKMLNAKQNRQEAEVIADAGLPGAVTIATNMAGRGTDILLGGHKNFPDAATWETRHAQVLQAGGLCVLGTERNESRRVDNQLAGRAGRQGDPGSSQFYLSLEDQLLRVFGSSKMGSFMQTLSAGQGHAVSHRFLDRAIAKAQRQLENRSFDARVELMKYDQVLAAQRKALYDLREAIMTGEVGYSALEEMLGDAVTAVVHAVTGEQGYPDEETVKILEGTLFKELGCLILLVDMAREESVSVEHLVETCVAKLLDKYAGMRDGSKDLMPREKEAMLAGLDSLWPGHLAQLEEVKGGIGLRQLAQENPVYAFSREGKKMFEVYRQAVCSNVARMLLTPHLLDIVPKASLPKAPAPAAQMSPVALPDTADSPLPAPVQGRNAPCHCGSGLRFKECHGRL